MAKSQIPRREVTSLPANHTGIALPVPNYTTRANSTASYVITVNLAISFHGTAGVRAGDCSLFMGEGRYEICWRHAEAAEMPLGEARAATSTE